MDPFWRNVVAARNFSVRWMLSNTREVAVAMKLLTILLLLLPPVLLEAQTVAPTAPTGLQPGDILEISIWREPDLSGRFPVDTSGRVTLPLIGEQQVSGVPIDQIRDRLLELYREQLRNPSITITPLRRIYVLGQVSRPGLYEVNPTISLAGAIALAGGANPEGDLSNLKVVRDNQVVVDQISSESALASIHVLSGDQIFVGRRSWFERNSTFLVSALLSVTSIVISLMR